MLKKHLLKNIPKRKRLVGKRKKGILELIWEEHLGKIIQLFSHQLLYFLEIVVANPIIIDLNPTK